MEMKEVKGHEIVGFGERLGRIVRDKWREERERERERKKERDYNVDRATIELTMFPLKYSCCCCCSWWGIM